MLKLELGFVLLGALACSALGSIGCGGSAGECLSAPCGWAASGDDTGGSSEMFGRVEAAGALLVVQPRRRGRPPKA